MAFWVMSAKQEETRLRRLDQLIASASRGSRIPVPGRADGAKSKTTRPKPAKPRARARR
jgi:hypothetical protein